MEGMNVKKAIFKKIAPLVSAMLAGMFLLAACDSAPPRVLPVHTLPLGSISTNFNHDDPRRQINTSIVFEVFDEAAVEELAPLTFIMRNAVLSILAELTLEDITTNRNLDYLGERIVERANNDLGLNIDLIVRAYFTDFAIV
jgi:flagellar basal body-associated protein FliL